MERLIDGGLFRGGACLCPRADRRVDLPHEIEVIHLHHLHLAEKRMMDHVALQLVELLLVRDFNGFAALLFFLQCLDVPGIVGDEALGLDVIGELFLDGFEFFGRVVLGDEFAEIGGGFEDRFGGGGHNMDRKKMRGLAKAEGMAG